ncbi:unnamed protein product [Clonostachys byssicola]|uniref:Zn(2)-C6 fungal-type domain-containing protein n=1 Tax=Clonostachys byssicola TaxID=160290 RepID=A0A9N9YA87_9HYPO|nr:unnamed protein product [Clonostachys byssicola]
MHNSQIPHPTQVRSACEHCRKQKLRCTRPSALADICTRCQHLGLYCQLGPSRKVGRPSKRDLAAGKKKGPAVGNADAITSRPSPSLVHLARGAATPELIFDPHLLGQGPSQPTPVDVGSIDWMVPEMSDYLLNSVHQTVLPSLPIRGGPSAFHYENMPQRYPPSDVPPQIIHLIRREHFNTLSRINVELHTLWETMKNHPANGTFESFLGDCSLDDGTILKPYQSLMTLLQDYLITIKAIHKALGTRQDTVKSRAAAWKRACLILQSNSPDDGSPQDQPPTPVADRVLLDSPSALLIISCFSQIVQHLEIFLSITQSRLLDPRAPFIAPANASFAGVPVFEYLTQGALFAEVLWNSFAQMVLVLGLPTSPWWSGNSVWTGLLAEDRFRDLLNHELGCVEDKWTTRPTNIMLMLNSIRQHITDSLLSGCMDV